MGGHAPPRDDKQEAGLTTLHPSSISEALTDQDLYWFNEGTHRGLGHKLGAHPLPNGGVRFAVWAPNAAGASVVGDFNSWDASVDPLTARGVSGIWEGTVSAAA